MAAQRPARAPQGAPARARCSDLRVDRIDLYQLHAPDENVPYAESVGALKELQDEGKIRHIGVSNVSVEQLAEARAIVDVVTVQNRFNLIDREDQDVLDVCERDGIGFIPWFPLEAGKLAEPGGVVDGIAERHGATHGQVALAWLLQRSPVVLPIPGTGSVAHLEENVAAARPAPRRPGRGRARLRRGLSASYSAPSRGPTAARPSARCRARAPARGSSAR